MLAASDDCFNQKGGASEGPPSGDQSLDSLSLLDLSRYFWMAPYIRVGPKDFDKQENQNDR